MQNNSLETKQVLIKTPLYLLAITKNISILHFSQSQEIAIYAACLVAFFSFFQKSKLFPPSAMLFDQNEHLNMDNVFFCSSGALIIVSQSKIYSLVSACSKYPCLKFQTVNSALVVLSNCPCYIIIPPLLHLALLFYFDKNNSLTYPFITCSNPN